MKNVEHHLSVGDTKYALTPRPPHIIYVACLVVTSSRLRPEFLATKIIKNRGPRVAPRVIDVVRFHFTPVRSDEFPVNAVHNVCQF